MSRILSSRPECLNKSEEHTDRVKAEGELRPMRKVKAILRFTLDGNKSNSPCDKQANQTHTGVYRTVRSPILFAISKD